MTAQDLINAGLTLCGRLRFGAQPSGTESAVALDVLNGMIDSWKAERLMVSAIQRTLFPVVANQNVYTIGQDPTADIVLEWPEKIDNAGWMFTNVTPQIEVPMRILNPQEWAALSPKGMTSTIATMLYYQPFAPLGNINLWPVPILAYQIALYTWRVLSRFASVDAIAIFQPAYEEAIKYNLAVRLFDYFPPETVKLSPMTVKLAMESLAKVKTRNTPELLMQCETGDMGGAEGKGRYMILSNRYNPGG